MIISVDHGNKSIKTPNALFTSGLISSEGLQGFKTDYICWNGRYYTLTEQRIAYLRDKTEDERFYVLTLFAIAKELERIAAERKKAEENLQRIEAKLANESFTSRAPENVVNAESEKAEKARALIAKLDASAAAMKL